MTFTMQSSLIPTVVALADFFRDSFPHIGWYQYWYLGTPFRYLLGPIIPLLLIILERIIPFLSTYYLYNGVIILSVLVGGVGIYFFISNLVNMGFGTKLARGIGMASGILYVFLPLNWMMLYFQNGLKIIAFSVIPFIFLLYYQWISSFVKKRGSVWKVFILVLLISFCLLINVESLLTLMIGMAIIFIILMDKRSVSVAESAMRSILIVFLSICIVTFWYGPDFWWVILSNPSFGGVPLWHVVLNVLSSGLQFLPLVFAVLVVKWRHARLKKYESFGVYFFVSFLVLTGVRFLSNPVFVIDWISFGPEIQFGGAILGGIFLVKLRNTSLRMWMLNIVVLIIIACCLVLSGDLIKGVIFYTKSEYQSRILELIDSQKINKNERIFMSGSPVFWVNQYLPLAQVRGGNDGASINPSWADGAYQVREGETAVLTSDWMRIFGSSYILVNQPNSQELFNDFKHQEKFQEFRILKYLSGDSLLKIPDVSMARVANSSLLSIGKPFNGSDVNILSAYIDSFVRPVNLVFENPDTIRVDSVVSANELISLAVSYDAGWSLRAGVGTIMSDSLGNLVIVPTHAGKQQFILEYRVRWISFVIVGLVTLLVLMGMIYSSVLTSWMRVLVHRLQLGINEDEDY